MTTQNENVPVLRFSEFNSEWSDKKLEDISVFLDGRRKPIKESDRAKMKGIYPYYGASGIIDYVNDYIFDEDIILLGEDGENIISRNLPLAFRVSGKCWINNHAHVIKPDNYTEIDFLTQSLENISYVQYNTGTAQPKLNQEVCRKIPLKLPTLPEQQKIAAFLTTVDEKIQQLAKKENLLEQYKKGAMQKIFNQEIRFKDDSENDFADWEEKPLNDFLFEARKRNGDLKYSKQQVLSVSGDVGIVNQIQHLGRSYAGESVHNYHIVETGDIVYTKSPLKSNPYGIIKVNKGVPGIVSTLYAVYRCKENILGEFIDYYFEIDDNTNKYLRPLVRKGAKNDMKVNNAHVLTGSMSIPSIPEQRKIVDFFNAMDRKINSVNQQLEKTKEYKKGLLQQMFVQNF